MDTQLLVKVRRHEIVRRLAHDSRQLLLLQTKRYVSLYVHHFFHSQKVRSQSFLQEQFGSVPNKCVLDSHMRERIIISIMVIIV